MHPPTVSPESPEPTAIPGRAARRTRPGRGLVAVLAAAGLLFAACSDDDTDTAATDAEVTTDESMDDDAMTDDDMSDEDMAEDDSMADDDAMADDDMSDEDMAEDDSMSDDMDDESMTDDSMSEDAMMGATGAGCAAVPTDGEGSFAGMVDDPAATAASNNPVLSTLVAAVTEAGLVDTLNGEGPFTIFAPTNDAFDALGDQLDAVMADPDLLTSVLTLHVVAGEQLSAEDLVAAGSATTVNGAELTFAADGDAVTVNGSATTICQDVPTANATVHIIDAVLVPEG